ncbi:unnamed protein product [Owenia fusiformis]|uniref:Uncharacterized protein n=1 Tax=Owenia fusiformis TaxID=6347 RepID=A0A8S4NG66_OWEFU|nr:unnamed protein product [Owenia fusiformis]
MSQQNIKDFLTEAHVQLKSQPSDICTEAASIVTVSSTPVSSSKASMMPPAKRDRFESSFDSFVSQDGTPTSSVQALQNSMQDFMSKMSLEVSNIQIVGGI